MNISDLLHDAVDGIEPAERIDQIRARTASAESAAARPWFRAAGAVVLATAAAVAAFARLGDDSPAPEHGPSHHAGAPETFLVPAYFIGATPSGPRLFREFDQASGHDALNAALTRIQRPASDPDYTTAWSPGAFESATLGEGTIDVAVGDADPVDLVIGDTLAIQQVAFTLQGAARRSWPVRFLDDGASLLTVDTLPQTRALSPISISDPAEGTAFHGSMTARGRADSATGIVRWELRDERERVVAEGATAPAGSGGRLYAWEDEVDLNGIPHGTYTFVAMTDDPTNGAGSGPVTDTRRISVR